MSEGEAAFRHNHQSQQAKGMPLKRRQCAGPVDLEALKARSRSDLVRGSLYMRNQPTTRGSSPKPRDS